jgi:hypothetical protein
MANERERGSDRQMAESQIAELQNVRVLLEEARGHTGSLSEHRRRRLDAPIRAALREVDAQLRDLSRDLSGS